MLAEKMAGQMFKTSQGLKTGAELAREIQNGARKLDFESQDGNLTGKIRGEKAIAEGQPVQMQSLNKANSEKYGASTSDGAIAGKSGENIPSLETNMITPELQAVLPIIRELTPEKIQEVLKKWTQAEPGGRSRMGNEFRVLKGLGHLSAIKAVASFEETSDGEETVSNTGERVDFQTGHRLDMKLNPMRTIVRALAQGGIIDNRTEVREKRISTDAPHLLYVVDGSGSMGYQNRMQSAQASVQAVGYYYGPKGATGGAIAFADDPLLLVAPPERDFERVVSAILDITPKWGTSYAKGMEMAIRVALPKSTILVFGDFEDGGVVSEETRALTREKELKIIGIISNSGNATYAAEICNETFIVDFKDPAQAALVALKVAQ
jgi:Mg-chelatase subunit ChlD